MLTKSLRCGKLKMKNRFKKVAALVLGVAMMVTMGVSTSLAAKSELTSLPTQKQGSYTAVPTYAIQRYLYHADVIYRTVMGGATTGRPDGQFGSKTTTAVRQFQGDRRITVDGIAGKGFYGAMNSYFMQYSSYVAGGYQKWSINDRVGNSGNVGVIQRGTTSGRWGTWNKSGSYIVM